MYSEPQSGNAMNAAKKSRKAIIDHIIRHAKNHLAANQLTLVTTFIRQYYSNVPLDEINERSIEDLFSMVLSHWNLIYHRNEGESIVRAFNPTEEKDSWHSTHSIVSIVTEDMPFLVDSMRMELNRLGYSTHLVIHLGGMQVIRNKKGQITKLHPFETRAKEGLIEAPIYMEIDRQNDPKKLKEIEENLQRVLSDVRVAVADWSPMQDRVKEAIDYLTNNELSLKKEDTSEAVNFLQWLLQEHFTFLGFRQYKVVQKGDEKSLRIVAKSGLGVLHDERHSKSLRHLSSLPPEARKLALSKQILIISKTNTKSTVHRPTYTDYIGVKRFDENGEIIGEMRFIGLFTSDAYNSEPQDIPYFRQKVQTILEHSGVLHHGHAAKALLNIVETLPRDDLFQGSVEELTEMALGIWHLQERRRIRLFARRDAYNRYMSCLVYIPRDNINTDLILKIQEVLVDKFNGHEVSYSTYFPESILARIHYIIRINPKERIQFDLKSLENNIVKVGRTWKDSLRTKLLTIHGEEQGNVLIARYIKTFPAGFREVFNPRSAVYDIDRIEEIRKGAELAMTFYRPSNAEGGMLRFKLYRFDQTIPLSDALPMLENMGLRVLSEQPYEIFLEGRSVWLNDFHMYYPYEKVVDVEEMKLAFQDAFYRIWKGDVGNDRFNRLVLSAKLSWRQVSILRAYAKYLRQAGTMFSQEYIAEAFNNNPEMSRLLVKLFETRFKPDAGKERDKKMKALLAEIDKKLDQVASLDEDRIIRRYVKVIMATLRTNFYQLEKGDIYKKFIAFKFDPKNIPDLPLPLPAYETYVYSPRVEGVHLRSSNVARGGLRWSDRREDFRTEVLGLVKAQQVKNAVIVPSGAKGGFVCKRPPVDGSREEILQEGIECYKIFIRGLLDVVDNIKNDRTITPKNTVCYDEKDPYLVVAADKGTASFSDIANSISEEYQFWLGDAFASGGSAGYDHKKIGITARGAWESVKCHFRELGRDPHKQPFTAIGIGDMSGDVFGNGLLMTDQFKLVAAFNHMHIFLDPNPNVKKSYQERIRLFNTPRSTWEDYNPKLISKGGGVFKRSAKSVKLSPEVKMLLGVTKDALMPNDLVKAILKAEVDLLWNGGIGTFVKATTEENSKVGDRANDNSRINGNQVRALIVAEGGNLGFTQLARIEYALNGGRLITDFIDNSAGVDCSDREVNIKILLGKAISANKLSAKNRNPLLSAMTDDVSELVLNNNYRQARAISYACHKSLEYLELYRQFMDSQEKAGRLPRSLEFLPSEQELNERKANSIGLTSPELAVLTAYSKILLKNEILNSHITEEPYLFQYVKAAFPERLAKQFSKQMHDHRLRREIIATQLSNDIVTTMGVTFVYQMQDETSHSVEDVIKAYILAAGIFDLPSYIKVIEQLDYVVDVQAQFDMLYDVMRLVRRSTRWYLRKKIDKINLIKEIESKGEKVHKLIKAMHKSLVGSEKEHYQSRMKDLTAANVDPKTAKMFAITRAAFSALNIIEAANKKDVDPLDVVKIYFGIIEKLDLVWFREQINSYPINNHWAVLARAAFKGDLDSILRMLTISVLGTKTKSCKLDAILNNWMGHYQEAVTRWHELVVDLRNATAKEFSMLSVAMRELVDLAQLSTQKETKDDIH